jgi:hypothetical protein
VNQERQSKAKNQWCKTTTVHELLLSATATQTAAPAEQKPIRDKLGKGPSVAQVPAKGIKDPLALGASGLMQAVQQELGVGDYWLCRGRLPHPLFSNEPLGVSRPCSKALSNGANVSYPS